MLEFVRPALHAAIELGRTELQIRLSAGIRNDADALLSGLRLVHDGSGLLEETANAIRRMIPGLALDENVSVQESRNQLD